MSKMIDLFKAARRAGTPIIAINTFDPERTMLSIQEFNEKTPMIQWDTIFGWTMRNKLGQQAMDKALDGKSVEDTIHHADHLTLALKLPFDPEAQAPTNPILFILNGHKYFDEKDFVQALWNLRDSFKESLRSVVLLGPDFLLPPELQQDVLVLDEPLPTDTQLADRVRSITKKNEVPCLDNDVDKAVDALRGLGWFQSEQATAMSLTRAGLDFDSLWTRKKQMIQQTHGLSVWKEGQKFDDLGGLNEIKKRFRRMIKGKACPRVVVWIDEIEKGMAGTGPVGDSSGTSQDQLGVILSEMQDKEYSGTLLVGWPGGGKSAFAKALANEIGVLTIKLDLGAMKAGIVGDSEKNIRQAMKIIEAVGGYSGAFFVATSNDISVVKPELKRRMKLGIWYFDELSPEEQRIIWGIYITKYFGSVNKDDQIAEVNASGWTGAEIETCVKTAFQEDVTLAEAASSIIPVAKSGKDEIEALRSQAHNRYNSVSYEGAFDKNRKLEDGPSVSKERKIAVGS